MNKEDAQPSERSPSSQGATTPSPVPPPVPVATHPIRGAFKTTPHRPIPEPNRLAPQDAFYAQSPPRLRPLTEIKPVALNASAAANAAAAALRPAVASLRPPPAIPTIAQQEKKKRSLRRRRGPPVWKKLLWVKQAYPDNYTDTETFLKHLERNPRFRPYEFWSLVAESTVIVQHVCSVVIFVCCFVGIVQDRISSTSIVTIGSVVTILGWVLWDYWIGQEQKEKMAAKAAKDLQIKTNGLAVPPKQDDGSSVSSTGSFEAASSISKDDKENQKPKRNHGLGLSLSTTNLPAPNGKRDSVLSRHSRSTSGLSLPSTSPISPKLPSPLLSPFPSRPGHPFVTTSKFSPRIHTRLKTFKSALLIYCALLGLSPILQSLTKSTSSDSIWALATWLICINIFFFDYGGSSAPPTSSTSTNSSSNAATSAAATTFPASLSTNAAVMASTVLASRLTSTSDVSSLTLFSIQVFGLFPVFRRHLRHVSARGHYFLTFFLAAFASAGLSIILTSRAKDWWGVLGRVIGGEIVGLWGLALVMGGCSWWLIGLQRYKNVVIGPWDPARPILKARPRGMTDA